MIKLTIKSLLSQNEILALVQASAPSLNISGVGSSSGGSIFQEVTLQADRPLSDAENLALKSTYLDALLMITAE